jgi:quercetin dioxygenase-like cupin family protein
MYVVTRDAPPLGEVSREFVGADHVGVDLCVLLVDTPPGTGPALHRHPYDEVVIVQEGVARWTVGAEQRDGRAGDILVARAGGPHAFVNVGEGALRQVDIHANGRFVTEWLEAADAWPTDRRSRVAREVIEAPARGSLSTRASAVVVCESSVVVLCSVTSGEMTSSTLTEPEGRV